MNLYGDDTVQCQSEIRRLRSVVRQDEGKIERLSVLLCNAIEYINELTGEKEPDWYEETLGITAEEMSELDLHGME